MNFYRNAFRAITGRYKDDFQFNEDRFENEDGPEDEDSPEVPEEHDAENVVKFSDENPPLEEAA